MRKRTRIPCSLVLLLSACTTAQLDPIHPPVAPVTTVSLEVVGLEPRDESYFERVVARALRRTDVKVSAEPVSFVPHARAEFDHYDRGNFWLRFITLSVRGRPSFDVTWTVSDLETGDTLAVCRVDAWVGWGQLGIGSGLKRAIVYSADRLGECLTGRDE